MTTAKAKTDARARRDAAVEDSAEGAADYVLEEQVGHLLRRAHQRHTAIFTEQVAGAQITATQWATVFKLRERGSVSQNHLGRLTAMDAATMQGVVQRLTARGLVLGTRDPRDRRRSVLRLTAEGVTLVDALLPTAARITRETLAPLSPQERETFLSLLRRLT